MVTFFEDINENCRQRQGEQKSGPLIFDKFSSPTREVYNAISEFGFSVFWEFSLGNVLLNAPVRDSQIDVGAHWPFQMQRFLHSKATDASLKWLTPTELGACAAFEELLAEQPTPILKFADHLLEPDKSIENAYFDVLQQRSASGQQVLDLLSTWSSALKTVGVCTYKKSSVRSVTYLAAYLKKRYTAVDFLSELDWALLRFAQAS